MSNQKYIVLTLEDAKEIAEHLPDGKIRTRLQDETGADIQEIVDQLKGMTHCHACVVEGQRQYCEVNFANKIGRRINRLLESARYERQAGKTYD